ncbi:MAG: hypothetical protein QY326_08270 [Bdellovibrionota bacterium]|nr:MAG: hypothetical protein QY326_08270 [Bdellovibrionota bacterium]
MHLAIDNENPSFQQPPPAGFLTEDVLPWRADIPALLAKDHRHGPALRSLEVRVVLRPVPDDLSVEVTERFNRCKDRLSSRCLKLFELVRYGSACMVSHEYVPALPLQEFLERTHSPLKLQQLVRQLGELVLEEESIRSELVFTPLDILVGEDGVLRFDTAAALLREAHHGEQDDQAPLATVVMLRAAGERLLTASRRKLLHRFGVSKADTAIVSRLLEAIDAGSKALVWQLAMDLTTHFSPRPNLLAHTLVSQAKAHIERQELRRGWYVVALIAFYSFTLMTLVAIFSASRFAPNESEEKDLSSRPIGNRAIDESY